MRLSTKLFLASAACILVFFVALDVNLFYAPDAAHNRLAKIYAYDGLVACFLSAPGAFFFLLGGIFQRHVD